MTSSRLTELRLDVAVATAGVPSTYPGPKTGRWETKDEWWRALMDQVEAHQRLAVATPELLLAIYDRISVVTMSDRDREIALWLRALREIAHRLDYHGDLTCLPDVVMSRLDDARRQA